MQYLAIIVAAAIMLTAIQAALGFVLIVLGGALLISAIWRPAQSLGVVLLLGYIYLLGQYGWATLAVTAVLMIMGYVAKQRGW